MRRKERATRTTREATTQKRLGCPGARCCKWVCGCVEGGGWEVGGACVRLGVVERTYVNMMLL